MRQIASEGRKLLQLDDDFINSIRKLRLQILTEESNTSVIPGFIQVIMAVPFMTVFFNETSVRLYHTLSHKTSLHCDATGTIVSLPKRQQMYPAIEEEHKRLLYYSLVLQHPSSGQPPIPVEMISAVHSATWISVMFMTLRRSEQLLYGTSNLVTPPQIVIDRSMALLVAVLNVYNGESLSYFLERSLRMLQNKASERDYEKMIPRACISHVMKDYKTDLLSG